MSDADFGPSEVELLFIVEVDERGDRVADVVFNPNDLDAAYAELDRLYAEGEAAPFARTWERCQRVFGAVASRNWDDLAAVLAPDFLFEDHRPLGPGILSKDEAIALMRALVELRPDAIIRNDHVLAINDRGALIISHWEGDEAGGQFEIPSIGFDTAGPDGRRLRWDAYDWSQLDEARAHFAELGAERERG